MHVHPAQEEGAVQTCTLSESGAERLVVDPGVEITDVHLWWVTDLHVVHHEQQVLHQLPTHADNLFIESRLIHLVFRGV